LFEFTLDFDFELVGFRVLVDECESLEVSADFFMDCFTLTAVDESV